MFKMLAFELIQKFHIDLNLSEIKGYIYRYFANFCDFK